MIIRKFRESDRRLLSNIYLLSRKIAFPWLDSASFALADFDRDTEGEHILVGELGSSLVGFVSIEMPKNFIHNLYIHPHYMRGGYGSRLLTEALSKIKASATLKCQKQNSLAFGFYKSKGWVQIDTGQSQIGEYYVMENRNAI